MPSFELILTLEEDAVFSERAATIGGHRSLDYIPGSALLGAAASQLYSQLSTNDAFTLFHSGQVRFSNGLPLGAAETTAWPIPLCWHQVKGEQIYTEHNSTKQFIAKNIWLGAELPDNKQPQQLRNGYVTNSGACLQPRDDMRLRMKTSIDFNTGRARTGMLFGYEAISAGQRFRSQITADASVDSKLITKLRKVFTNPIYLGRSRSAEYGRVTVTVRDWAPKPLKTHTSKHITLWLLSDLAALDDKGQPTFAPKPEWLGLPPGQLLLDRTFLRTRRYSTWNAHRASPDLERQVIGQGSVLTFELTEPCPQQTLAQLAAGIGAHQEVGLGQVDPNPFWLHNQDQHPYFETASAVTEHKKPTPSVHKSALVKWLEGEQYTQQTRSDITTQVRELISDYRACLRSARILKGLADDVEIGPSASQWGNVLAKAKEARDSRGLGAGLFEGNSCACKETMSGWQDEYWTPQGLEKFSDWIRKQFNTNQDTRFMQTLAREILDVVRPKINSSNKQPK